MLSHSHSMICSHHSHIVNHALAECSNLLHSKCTRTELFQILRMTNFSGYSGTPFLNHSYIMVGPWLLYGVISVRLSTSLIKASCSSTVWRTQAHRTCWCSAQFCPRTGFCFCRKHSKHRLDLFMIEHGTQQTYCYGSWILDMIMFGSYTVIVHIQLLLFSWCYAGSFGTGYGLLN